MQLIKKFTGFLAILIIFSACVGGKKTHLHASQYIKGKAAYGDSIKEGNVLDIGGMQTVMQKAEKMEMRLSGKVENVCKEKGCYIAMKLDDGKEIHIRFKNHSFFVPQSVKGKQVLVSGFAYYDSIPVEKEPHYAHIAGKSETQISNIHYTAGSTDLAFEATGLVVL